MRTAITSYSISAPVQFQVDWESGYLVHIGVFPLFQEIIPNNHIQLCGAVRNSLFRLADFLSRLVRSFGECNDACNTGIRAFEMIGSARNMFKTQSYGGKVVFAGFFA